MLGSMASPSEHHPLRILVAYDGSTDADAAIDLAAATFPGARTTLLSVWEPLIQAGHLDGPRAEAMHEIASRAAERARSLGLEAESRWQADATDVSRAIVDGAARERAQLIVLGRRGLAGHHSPLDGSVAQRVLRNADRPVMVVPSAQTAEPVLAPMPERAVGDGGLRMQVVPLEEV